MHFSVVFLWLTLYCSSLRLGVFINVNVFVQILVKELLSSDMDEYFFPFYNRTIFPFVLFGFCDVVSLALFFILDSVMLVIPILPVKRMVDSTVLFLSP